MQQRKGDREIRGGLLDAPETILSAAHELKSPLVLIRQLALELQEESSLESSGQLLRQIQLTSERALNLTTNLTKTARLEDGLFTLEPVNVAELCDDVARHLQPLYRDKQRVLRVQRRRTHAPLVVANRELLRQVLVNFADNALHYSTSNVPVDLTIGVNKRHNSVRLGVRDYGPAVQAEQVTQHTRPGSSRLGLLIARQFADAMQSEIGVTRHRDGATYYIDLSVSTQLSLL